MPSYKANNTIQQGCIGWARFIKPPNPGESLIFRSSLVPVADGFGTCIGDKSATLSNDPLMRALCFFFVFCRRGGGGGNVWMGMGKMPWSSFMCGSSSSFFLWTWNVWSNPEFSGILDLNMSWWTCLLKFMCFFNWKVPHLPSQQRKPQEVVVGKLRTSNFDRNNCISLHPRKLTAGTWKSPENEKESHLNQTSIFGFHVSFRGSNKKLQNNVSFGSLHFWDTRSDQQRKVVFFWPEDDKGP